MATLTLDVTTRDLSRKAKSVLREGNIPAVFYGKGEENLSIQMDYQEFRRTFNQAGESSLIELSVDGGKSKKMVLVQSVTKHPVTDKFTHVDFLNVNMKEEITTNIPLEFVGTSVAVKDLGGTLSTARTEVEVRCLPTNMPHHLEVDIAKLEDFHTALHVSDIVVPEGVEILTESELTIATVSAPAAAEEDKSATEEAGDAPAAEEAKEESEG